MTGYSAFRIFEESLRVDSSEHFLGLRLNMYVACVLAVAGGTWFAAIQRRGRRAVAAGRPYPELAAGGAQASRVGATDADGAVTEAIVPAGPEEAVAAEAPPAVADPAVADPAVADPAVADPAVADPAVADPAVADPAVADPAVADPAGSAATAAGSEEAGR